MESRPMPSVIHAALFAFCTFVAIVAGLVILDLEYPRLGIIRIDAAGRTSTY